MDALLVELTRSRGSNVRVTLEIHGAAGEPGYPKDVVDTVHLLKDVFEGRKFEDGKPVSTQQRKNAA